MIKINLLGDDTIVDTSGIWLVIGYGLSVVALVIACALVYSSASSRVEELTAEKESLEKRLMALRETTKEVRDLEKKKKELADKTNVIAILRKSKIGPVRVMDDLNIALPEKSWITEVRENGGFMRIVGLALDNQTIANFMRELDKSDYFSEIDLGETRQTEKGGVKLKEFTLQAKVSYAGAEQPKTVEGESAAKARLRPDLRMEAH